MSASRDTFSISSPPPSDHMHPSFRPTPLVGLLLIAACTDRAPAGPRLDTAAAETPCRFTPASTTLRPDSVVTFLPGPGCGRIPRMAILTWEGAATPPRAGLVGMKESSCGTSAATGRRVWKVIRCVPGPFRLTIYTDTLGTTVLQEIEVADPSPVTP
jgi:hypothetical protein